jgi:hypothetical protein
MAYAVTLLLLMMMMTLIFRVGCALLFLLLRATKSLFERFGLLKI